jgi:hypothetical protein
VATSTRSAERLIDFSNVKEGGQSFNKKRVPSGDYLAKITKVEDRPSKSDGVMQWLFTIELVNQYTDRKYPFYCKLVENQLWKLRNLCLAAGMPIPKKKIKLDPNRLVGKLIGVTMEDDEYDGKPQSNVSATFPASEIEENTEDVDGLDETEEDEEEDEEADDEVDSDETEDEDDEEEEEEPAPPVKKAAAKKAVPAQRTKSSTRKAVEAVTEDELEELDLEDL